MKLINLTVKELREAVGKHLCELLEDQIKEEELINDRGSQMIIKKIKLEILLRKECFINQNPKLRKCLISKYQDHLAFMIEYAETDCADGLAKENNYIGMCNTLKEDIESEHIQHELFGNININVEALIDVYKNIEPESIFVGCNLDL
jgi:hypothetical protein